MIRRVLFVDDEPQVLAGLRKAMRSFRHRWAAQFANSAEEALRMLSAGPLEVVISDARMPGVDGLQATRMIRKLEAAQGAPSHIPIIAMTANNDESDKEDCREAGMDGFITKPIEIKTIAGTIREIIESARRSR